MRDELERIDESDDPVLVAVADAARRYPIPLDAFGELVDGAEMDVRGTDYATFAELELYCRCVAGSIGRLALGVFDCSDRAAGARARRRPRPRAAARQHPARPRRGRPNGRVYLPREDLERFGCEAVAAGRIEGPVELVIAFEAQRALDRLDRGLGARAAARPPQRRLRARDDGRLRPPARADRRRPAVVLRGRLSLRRWEKGLVLARSLVGGIT